MTTKAKTETETEDQAEDVAAESTDTAPALSAAQKQAAAMADAAITDDQRTAASKHTAALS